MNPRRIGGILLLAAIAGALHAAVPDLRPFDSGSLEAIKQTHQGRAFIVALWSVSCEPCREDMPHWGPLQRKFPQISIVLVATDGAAGRRAVEAMLASYDLGRVERWIFADDYTERLRYAIDSKWRGELPRTYLFDASHRSEAITGVIDPKRLESWAARQATPRQRRAY